MKTANQAQRGAYGDSAKMRGIKRLRVLAGKTQPECARFCGVSLRTFQRAEAGDVVPMYVKRKIERALGVAW